jgi:hypothetical protein
MAPTTKIQQEKAVNTLAFENSDGTDSISFKGIIQHLSIVDLPSHILERRKKVKKIFLQLGLEKQAVRHFTLFTLQPKEDICQVLAGHNPSLKGIKTHSGSYKGQK